MRRSSSSILGGAQGGHEVPLPFRNGAKLRMKDCLDGLQARLRLHPPAPGRVLNVRHIPTLAFQRGPGLRKRRRVHELLKKLCRLEQGE